MILDIANELSIRKLLTETNDDLLNKIQNSDYDSVTCPNYTLLLKIAQKYKFEIISCDPEHWNIDDQIRVAAINKAIARQEGDASFIIGSGHLMDIINDDVIKNTYDILCFNTSNCGEEKNELVSKRTSPYHQEKINFSEHNENIFQLNIPANPYSLDFDDIQSLIQQIRDFPPKPLKERLFVELNHIKIEAVVGLNLGTMAGVAFALTGVGLGLISGMLGGKAAFNAGVSTILGTSLGFSAVLTINGILERRGYKGMGISAYIS